jgi:hypothetical protein
MTTGYEIISRNQSKLFHMSVSSLLYSFSLSPLPVRRRQSLPPLDAFLILTLCAECSQLALHSSSFHNLLPPDDIADMRTTTIDP